MQDKNPLKKRMKIMLISLGILFGLILMVHLFKSLVMKWYFSTHNDPVFVVSATKVGYQTWQSQLKSTGSVRAINGVQVTTEVGGLVKTICFTPGSLVKKGTLLVALNADPDIAQLHALEANVELAKITFKRNTAQLAVQAVSQATVDNNRANLKNQTAQMERQAALVDKKMIRAPFDGRLGICVINLGQYLSPGDKITTLESYDPIYVDFYLPQQVVAQVQVGQPITLSTQETGQIFQGKITTIDSAVDVSTRNIQIEATVPNPKETLLPGMFGAVTLNTGNPQKFLTLPQTAISFNPYGEIVYVLTPEEKELKKHKKKKPSETIYIAKQTFVTTGAIRGDQVTLLKGIKAGDLVVTSGQLKLKNNSRVTLNNRVIPRDDPAPQPIDE